MSQGTNLDPQGVAKEPKESSKDPQELTKGSPEASLEHPGGTFLEPFENAPLLNTRVLIFRPLFLNFSNFYTISRDPQKTRDPPKVTFEEVARTFTVVSRFGTSFSTFWKKQLF